MCGASIVARSESGFSCNYTISKFTGFVTRYSIHRCCAVISNSTVIHACIYIYSPLEFKSYAELLVLYTTAVFVAPRILRTSQFQV